MSQGGHNIDDPLPLLNCVVAVESFHGCVKYSHDELISAWAMMSKWPWSHCRKILLLWTAICLGFWTIWNWSNRTCNIQVRTLWLANKFLLCAYLWKPTVHWKMNQTKTTKCRSKKLPSYSTDCFATSCKSTLRILLFWRNFVRIGKTIRRICNLAIFHFSTQ